MPIGLGIYFCGGSGSIGGIIISDSYFLIILLFSTLTGSYHFEGGGSEQVRN